MYVDCHVIIFKQFRFICPHQFWKGLLNHLIYDTLMVGGSPDLLSLSSLVFKDEDKL